MATELPVFSIPGLTAGADLSTHQYKFVKLSASRTVILCAAATDKPIGILQNSPPNGGAAEVMAIGMSKVKCGASSIATAGTSIGTDASGLAGPKVHGTDTTNYVVGQVIEGVANANEVATVGINCFTPTRAA